MDNESLRVEVAASSWTQTAIALLMLFAAGVAFAVLLLAARSRSLERFFFAREYERFKQDREHFMNRGLFAEFEDRLLLQSLPGGDSTRGGVFLLGTSAMKWALQPRECLGPSCEQVHNYAIGATNHSMQLELAHYLVERHELLKPGADKVHVVLGLYWSMGLADDPARYWRPLWQRYGLYECDPTHGIRDVTMPAWALDLRKARAQVTSFLAGLSNRMAREISLMLGIPISATEKLREPELVRNFASQFVRRASDGDLASQVNDLRTLITFLQGRGVGVTCILLPHRTPLREMRFPQQYFSAVRDVCQRSGIRFVDWSELLSEDEFWDINHSNYRGLQKTTRGLLSIARDGATAIDAR